MSVKGVKESAKEVFPAPPNPIPEKERLSPTAIGVLFIATGIVLMILSGWLPFGAWDTASATEPPTENASIVAGTSGDDDIFGGVGSEAITAREGDDFIEAKDGVKDYVSCGPGMDTASVDGGLDVVASDCETVFGIGTTKQ